MMTVKIVYETKQTHIFEVTKFEADGHEKYISFDLPYNNSKILVLDGTETVYVENEAGRTIHTIRPIGRK